MTESREKSAVTVRIGGEDHVIRANVEPEYTLRCAKLVDDRITNIRNQLGLIESHKAAILAAMSITDELFQARRDLEEYRNQTAHRADGLARKLSRVLGKGEDSRS